MDASELRVGFARLLMLGAIACGIVGLIIGIVDREWKLGVTGWFSGGTLLAVLSVVVLADEFIAARRQKD